MVKYRRSNYRKNRNKKATRTNRVKARRINASTPFETCSEQLSPFGGLLALIKFLDLINFRQIFDFAYIAPIRKLKNDDRAFNATVYRL